MAVLVTVVVVYSLIWCQLSHVGRFRTSSASGRIPSQTTLGINGEVVGRGKDLTRKRKASESDLLSTRSAMTQQQRNTVRQRTVMMFLISLIFVLSFLPHFGTIIAAIFTKNVFDNLPTAQLALNNILLRSYFINSVSNPIIYSICCVNFRRAIMKSFTRRRHSKTTSTRDCSEMKRLQCISPQSSNPSVPEQTHSHSTPDVLE
ncbi:uncharacterized protein LOC124121325 [Haliotis rufescens]|uniref:uncharacterized protein LOC124121325 n=1 Tax=Haliotis rufescens TaxID=6454 RepID=UPI00201F7777|nr:uncharacterized protein LOC124121325 [Haliotis rufescens]